jgi:hypothetical protein
LTEEKDSKPPLTKAERFVSAQILSCSESIFMQIMALPQFCGKSFYEIEIFILKLPIQSLNPKI